MAIQKALTLASGVSANHSIVENAVFHFSLGVVNVRVAVYLDQNAHTNNRSPVEQRNYSLAFVDADVTGNSSSVLSMIENKLMGMADYSGAQIV